MAKIIFFYHKSKDMLYDVGRNTCYFLPKIRAQAGVLTNNLHFLTCACFVFQPHDANFACKKDGYIKQRYKLVKGHV